MKSVAKMMYKSNKNDKIDVNISNNEIIIGPPPLKSNSNFLKPLSIKNNDNCENNTHPHLPTTIRSFTPLTRPYISTGSKTNNSININTVHPSITDMKQVHTSEHGSIYMI
eukprot:466677_1